MSLPPNLRSGFARSKRKSKTGKTRVHENRAIAIHTQYASTSTGDIAPSNIELRYETQGASGHAESSKMAALRDDSESLPFSMVDNLQELEVEMQDLEWVDEEEEEKQEEKEKEKEHAVKVPKKGKVRADVSFVSAHLHCPRSLRLWTVGKRCSRASRLRCLPGKLKCKVSVSAEDRESTDALSATTIRSCAACLA